MPNHVLPTTVVGSYPQPDWLIDRETLSTMVPRVRMHDLWRVPESNLRQAQDDATILAIRDMERAGIDIISDGEIRRESYSNHFATALGGLDIDRPGSVTNRLGKPIQVPRVVSKIHRRKAVEVTDVQFLRQNTDRTIKITVPGPFTMAQQAQNDFYGDDEEMAMDFAAAVNEELLELKAAGADIIQLDEPWLQARSDIAGLYGVRAINRALEGVPKPTVVHLCFGYAQIVKGQKPAGYSFLPQLNATTADMISIEAAQPKLDLGVLKDISAEKRVMVGVLDLGTNEVETADVVADRIRAALKYLPIDRLMPAPDCGMKYLPREVAFGKLKALSDGAAIVRREVA